MHDNRTLCVLAHSISGPVVGLLRCGTLRQMWVRLYGRDRHFRRNRLTLADRNLLLSLLASGLPRQSLFPGDQGALHAAPVLHPRVANTSEAAM